MTTFSRLAITALMLGVVFPAPASAQLDPLLFLKTTQPNVILAVETNNRMQHDADGVYYDPGTYTKTGAAFEAALGLADADAVARYRRKFFDLKHSNINDASEKFLASRIEAVGDAESDYSTFYESTRLAVARRALIQAVSDNVSSARFGLLVRKGHATFSTVSAGNDSPVVISDASNLAQQLNGDKAPGKWTITRHPVGTANAVLFAADAAGANTNILGIVRRNVDNAPALRGAGADTAVAVDAPIGLLLDDAWWEATRLINADNAQGGCRNTIVVLVAGGAEGTINPQNLAVKAAAFRNINGRRVPIYVIGIYPSAEDAATLAAVARESGGQYFEITKAMAEDALASATASNPTPAVPEAVRGINLAVQHAFVPSTTFNIAPTPQLPFGPSFEHQVTSPIVGTVNLRGATKLTATGPVALPDSETYIFNGTTEIPQRSNVLVTSAFELPGFEARLRAFRVYKPIPDTTKPAGYRFSQDGSRLWENTAPPAESRNIYTVLPGSTTLVPFVASNAGLLESHLNVADAAALIDYVRKLPMGAIVGSTPAFLDAPSLDPPPDAEYPGFKEDNLGRRSLIFVGANDGMLHALDGRSGVEVWAFIPFNLLPKLKALRSGQSLDAFNYYVDSSPKIADVRIGDKWRTYLFFGQGPGGTFYNTLDVTLDDISDTVPEDSSNETALLTYFASANAIQWKWSFPRNTSFDTTIATTTAPFGELKPTASAAEQAMGETWSDPAIGQVQNELGPYVMVVGSGFLKYSVQNTYRKGVTRSGTTFYVLAVATGNVMGTPRDVGADNNNETNKATGDGADDCRKINDCRQMKNALQMDPVATGPLDQRFISKVYIGDLDGKVWRFTLSFNDPTVVVSMPTKLYDAGSDAPLFSSMATVNVGGANQYIFVGTGSDLLPSPDAANKPVVNSLLVLLDNGGSTASEAAEILLDTVDGIGADEKVTSFPAVAGDIVFFTTTSYNVTTPCTPYSANLYAFTFIGGPAYDTNNDGKLSTGTSSGTGGGKTGKGKKAGSNVGGDSQKVFATAGVRATAPFIVDQHLVFTAGGNIQMFGDPNDFNNGVGQAGVRILSWRPVR